VRRSESLGVLSASVLIGLGCSVGLLAAVAGALGGGSGVTVGTALTAYACGPSAPPVEGICATGGSVGTGPVSTGTWELPPGLPANVRPVLTFAVAQLGKPYLWGAQGPESYDCSGLVVASFAQLGLALPRVTYDQVNVGTPIYVATEVAPGDLLFFTGSDPGPAGAPGHVGIYLGSGVMVHAPQTGDVVKVSPVLWDGVVAIRRIVV
jgi:cell wall-associated NlpC family hydrolase